MDYLLIAMAAIAAWLALGAWRHRNLRDRLIASLDGPAPSAPRNDLPPIVEAFARRGLDGAVPAARIGLTQAAEMQMKAGGDWTPLTARQWIGISQPGFVWDARVPMGPITRFRVIDAFAGGEGHLQARILGSIRIAAASGPDMDQSEAMRYLAELPWAPDAILSAPGLSWTQTASDIVEVSMETRGGEARVALHFDAAGDIVRITARDRLTTDDEGKPARYDWLGTFHDYVRLGNRRIPARAEVGYVRPDGYAPYFRGRITAYSAE